MELLHFLEEDLLRPQNAEVVIRRITTELRDTADDDARTRGNTPAFARAHEASERRHEASEPWHSTRRRRAFVGLGSNAQRRTSFDDQAPSA